MGNYDDVRVFLEVLSELRILQDIIRFHLLVGDTLQVEKLHHGTRETTLWCRAVAFHEKHDWLRLDGLQTGEASTVKGSSCQCEEKARCAPRR